MHASTLSIASLLFGAALLFLAGGINSLILPVRGAAEGMNTFSLGLLGAGWAMGYVAGCLRVPSLVARVGHIRAFGVMAALATLSVLGSALVINPVVWIVLRGVAGFAFAGAAMIVESWLAEASDSSNRGRVFGLYTMILLGASTLGQLSLSFADTGTMLFFVVAAMLYSMSLIPTAISSSRAPQPLLRTRFDLPGLWRNSPLAVLGAFVVGISNASFGTLAAVYAGESSLTLATTTLFVSMPVLAGAITQLPIGWLSDRFDRRWVLAAVALIALMVDAAFVFMPPESAIASIAMAALFGSAVFAMYPVLVAHANDHARAEDALLTSGALLMVFGVGSMIGPTVSGVLMSAAGPRGLFATTLFAHSILVVYTFWRMTRREAVVQEDKERFQVQVPASSATPQTTAYRVAEHESLAREGVEFKP